MLRTGRVGFPIPSKSYSWAPKWVRAGVVTCREWMEAPLAHLHRREWCAATFPPADEFWLSPAILKLICTARPPADSQTKYSNSNQEKGRRAGQPMANFF